MRRLNGRDERGGALLVVMVLMVAFSCLVAAVYRLHVQRRTSSERADRRLGREYAAEAGLERARVEVCTADGWLTNNAGKTVATFNDGSTQFTVNNCTVTVRVSAVDGTWFLVESQADGQHGITVLGMTTKGRTCFADYARFVSAGNLLIGAYASYGGKVHANGNIGVQGEYVTFYDDVTCAGKISYTGQSRDTCVFHKSATPGVPKIDLPGADELDEIAQTAPKGATVYDWNDNNFRVKFQAATGVLPANDMEVKVVLKQDKMDVVTTSGGKTMTESDVDVPHEGAIYSAGPVTVSGNISRRMSILTPVEIYMDGPIRYTDDAGQGQWELQDKKTGEPMPFDAEAGSWSTMGNWSGSEYQYVEAPDWLDRAPVIDGAKINPALGLVNAHTIYVTGENDNREIHAALFSSGDVIRPKVGGQKKNLYIHGAIITTGTNPVSSYFSYRCYAYDTYLKGNPPPGFPGGDTAAFRNWHVQELEER